MQALPTGTVTFLFTDIEGSTKLWQDAPDAMRSALARHDVLLRDAIESSGGYVFKTVGDAFCAAFPTVPQALAAALAAQVALAAEPWELPTPLRIRLALHAGSAEERDGDYFGPPLNRVARLMAAGHGGQTLLSLAAQELTRDALPAATSLLDLGPHRLKDLGRPEHVYQVVHPSLPAEFPPLASLDNPALSNNLPQQVTSFIGREAQMAEVKALLTKTRLLTLTGAGGSGKSRLSLQVAADLLDGEGDGVWLVELAGLSDPALVPQAMAQVLGVQEQAGKSVQQALVEWLKPKRLLLILDNCEHLVAACASLAADILKNCPGVHLLASSREPLAVAGEQTYRVPSLSLPDPKGTQMAESLSQYEAVRLFIERAQAVQPAFAVTDVNAPAVAQICWRLDGIALAIELAAARVRSLSADEINTRLDQRFRLLTGGSRDNLPRQQTLRALIDWSYDLLTEPEKALLRRLSVFAGGWTLSAAEVVCLGDDVEDWEVVDLLTALVDKSLVAAEPAGDGTRYRLLETVRQYGGDRLGERGEVEAVQDGHLSWCLALAEEAEPQLTGPEQGVWLARLDTEHDNLRAALAWCDQDGAGSKGKAGLEDRENLEASLRLCGALWRFWSIRSHLSEGLRWSRRVLRDMDLSVTGGRQTPAARGKALTGAGNLAHEQGDYGVARAFHEQGLETQRQIGDEKGIANSLNNLANVAREQGDYGAARAFYEQSLEIKRQIGNQRGIANSLNGLGNVAHEQGDYGAARAFYEQCLEIQRRIGDEKGIANSLNNLGSVACEQGDYGVARALHEQGLEILRRIGDQKGVAYSLLGLGFVAHEQGDFGAARAFHEQGLEILRRIGDQRAIAESLEGLAVLASSQGQPERGVRLWGAAAALRERIGAPLPPNDRQKQEAQIDRTRQALGDAAFTAAWDAGRAMTLNEAVEYGLSEG